VWVRNFENVGTWSAGRHDGGTPGDSSGSTSLGKSPDNVASRKFTFSWQNGGGEIWSTDLAVDGTRNNFMYETSVWIENPAILGNLELDINHVMPDGRTVIIGFQCDGYRKVWDGYGEATKWYPTNVPCDLRKWPAKTWMHIQVAYHHDTNGVLTYDWVALNGQVSRFVGATAPAARAMGWGKNVVQTQFQLDGLGAGGSNTVYATNMNLARW